MPEGCSLHPDDKAKTYHKNELGLLVPHTPSTRAQKLLSELASLPDAEKYEVVSIMASQLGVTAKRSDAEFEALMYNKSLGKPYDGEAKAGFITREMLEKVKQQPVEDRKALKYTDEAPGAFTEEGVERFRIPSAAAVRPYKVTETMSKSTHSDQLPFYAYEAVGPVPVAAEVERLLATDEADKYRAYNGKKYESFAPYGGTVIPVLDFLEGLPFNNLVMAYVRGLKPSSVRVSTDGSIFTDNRTGRVTIYLKDNKVDRIEQEVHVSYACGAVVDRTLKALQEGREPSREPLPTAFGHTKGLERADFA